jgi:hypothetical protein
MTKIIFPITFRSQFRAMKRILVLIILASMMLHCASRIGFISYLYQNRHQIAYQTGLIAEVPVALCSSAYDFGKGLNIEHPDERTYLLPLPALQTLVISLFVRHADLNMENELQVLAVVYPTKVIESRYESPLLTIFRPPC